MPVYIAMLRGVNVGGHKRMKMDELRTSCEALGFEKVQTYVQSGNVVYKTAKQAPISLSKKLADRIVKDFGFSASVITRTGDEIGKVIQDNPLLKEKGIDVERLHVTFLSEVPSAVALKTLDGLPQKPDQFCCLKKEIYIHCPNGYGQTKLTNNLFEKQLAVVATTRNWQTVNSLYQMAQDYDG